MTDTLSEQTESPDAQTDSPSIQTESSSSSSSVYPVSCSSQCDAFAVTIQNYFSDDDSVCLSYKVQRLFSAHDSSKCSNKIQWFTLGVCDDDSDAAITSSDLNGLIQSFTVLDSYSSNRRRLYNPQNRYAWGSTTDTHIVDHEAFAGIRVNMHVDDALMFELCMTNVFMDDTVEIYADEVMFNRGNEEFICDDMHVQGLPCVDYSKFETGSYAHSGFNVGGEANGANRSKDVSEAVARENVVHVKYGDNQVAWIGVIVLFVMFPCCFVYLHLQRMKKRHKARVSGVQVSDGNINAVHVVDTMMRMEEKTAAAVGAK